MCGYEDETHCSSCEKILYLGDEHGKCPKCSKYICIGCRDNAPFKCNCGHKQDGMVGWD